MAYNFSFELEAVLPPAQAHAVVSDLLRHGVSVTAVPQPPEANSSPKVTLTISGRVADYDRSEFMEYLNRILYWADGAATP